jgi:hypothetical protein
MEKESLFVLLVYADGEDYCTPHVFRSMAALKKFVEDGIRQDYAEFLGSPYYNEDRMNKEIAEMRTAMDERGGWRDTQGNLYDCQEREIEG